MVGIYVVGDQSKGAEEGGEVCAVSVVTGCVSKRESVVVGEFGGVTVGEGGNAAVFGESGMFVCGPNNAKQLGVGKQAPLLARWVPANVGRVVRCVAPGSHHSLLCTSDGAAFSCGRGDGGQLGLGDKTKQVTSFAQVVLPSGTVAKQVAVASSARRFENQSASYVLTTSGACLSFGNNNHMKLGLGPGVVANAWQPAPVAHEGVAFEQISAGKHHVLACDAAGFVYAWGSGDMGRLGLGDKKHRGVPTKVELGIPVVRSGALDDGPELPETPVDVVVARETYSVAFSSTTGAVFTWGFGTRGQLGRGSAGTRGEPAAPGRVDLGHGVKIAKLAANDDACIGLIASSSTGHLVWGSLDLGDLKLSSQEPVAHLSLGTPLDNVLAFDLSNNHALVALRNDIPEPAPALPRAHTAAAALPGENDDASSKRPADEARPLDQPPDKTPKLGLVDPQPDPVPPPPVV